MKKILLPLFGLAALVSNAQKVSSKLTFQKGQTIEVTTNMNMTTQSMMGEMPMTMVGIDQYVVGESTPSQTQLTKTPKRMKISANMMGQDLNMDSDNPKDLEGQFGEPIKEIMKQKQDFTVDASGMVTAVKADEKKKADDNGMAGMMMPGMGAGNFIAVAGQPSIFKILPAHEVGKGDSWTDSVNTEGNNGSTTYTVKDITDKEILLDYTGQSKTKTKQTAMGMSVDVTADTKNTGTITLDRATGLLKQKTVTGTTESSINAGGQDLTTTSKMTVVITAKAM